MRRRCARARAAGLNEVCVYKYTCVWIYGDVEGKKKVLLRVSLVWRFEIVLAVCIGMVWVLRG